jgi:hypothetical protein
MWEFTAQNQEILLSIGRGEVDRVDGLRTATEAIVRLLGQQMSATEDWNPFFVVAGPEYAQAARFPAQLFDNGPRLRGLLSTLPATVAATGATVMSLGLTQWVVTRHRNADAVGAYLGDEPDREEMFTVIVSDGDRTERWMAPITRIYGEPPMIGEMEYLEEATSQLATALTNAVRNREEGRAMLDELPEHLQEQMRDHFFGGGSGL